MSGTRRKPGGFVFEQHFLKDDMLLVSSFDAAASLKLVKGTNHSDYIYSKPASERILGLGGNDEIWAERGNDVVFGGSGVDDLWGMNGNDILYGDAGNDRLFGGGGHDTLHGGAGNDQMDGNGKDWLYGEGGNDSFDLLTADKAFGGSGNDTFTIGNKKVEIHGGTGVDTARFEKSIAHFSIEYHDDGLLVEYEKGGFDTPKPSAVLGEEIERIEFRKGIVLDRQNFATPEIDHILTQSGEIEAGGVIIGDIQRISGFADPFSRIVVKSGNAILGTCITNENGQWRLYNIDPDAITSAMNIVAIADFGLAETRTSEAFPVEVSGIEELYSLQASKKSVVLKGLLDFEGLGAYTAPLGDVNGDGFDDALVAASLSGKAYVLFGGKDGLGNSELRGIEAFDLTGTGDNTLILAAADVFNLSPNRHGAFSAAESGNSLVVLGNSGDKLRLIDPAFLDAEWERVDQDVSLDGSAAGDFDIYHLVGDKGVLASVAVDVDISLLA